MKNRIVAALFALFLGAFGVHKFYLRDTGAGIFYLILMMVGSSMRLPISAFLGFIDALVLFTMSDEKFDAKYNKKFENRRDARSSRRDRYQSRTQRRYPARENYSSRDKNPEYNRRRETYTKPPSRRPERTPRRPRENPFKKTGISKYKDFDLEGAIEDFNKGLELDPSDMALHFNLACAYSLTEKPEKSFFHISRAVENGFKDFEKIKTHDDLAFMRIQDEFEPFEANGFRLKSGKTIPVTDEEDVLKKKASEPPKDDLLQDDILLSQLKKLSELRNKGLLSEKEYSLEKEKLMRR
jgi:TM2 domain-containing membrane protein YozV